MLNQEEENRALDSLGLAKATTRRGFLKLGAAAGVSVAAASAFSKLAMASGFAAPAMPIMTNFQGDDPGGPNPVRGVQAM